MTNILEVRDVTKIYEEGNTRVRAIDSVSLALNKGEVLLIMGPSGSGKTTLLSMMGCILSTTSGDIIIEDIVVNHLRRNLLPDIRKRYFGFVFQSFNLFPSLKAAENVEVVLRLKNYNKQSIKMEAMNLLDRVGLYNRANFFPRDLSGGEKQRVAFARALAGNPPIILADEPTANLDSKTGREVLEILKRLAEESDKAIAIVSHDPKAEALAHRIIYIEDGRIKQ
ncbi:MAG: ABC transporter ATP-binding protein [Nitrospirae bacterium]|nr:ABC transporter ATP-binding protein [Nitrospirota bacterium]